ncbi:DUF6082 family protein [Nonomuraea sp. H19]|uniref:DUF6082 family protein n=1 Tax=Nonomuraea sp. H19 TaxID=3452206 RepID=UPI003F8B99AA
MAAASLLVLAVSVTFQARTARIASETAVRMLHVEMIRFVIEDPSLMQLNGAKWDGTEEGAETMGRRSSPSGPGCSSARGAAAGPDQEGLHIPGGQARAVGSAAPPPLTTQWGRGGPGGWSG